MTDHDTTDDCECCAELRGTVEELQEQVEQLTNQTSRFDDFTTFITKTRLPKTENKIDDVDDRVAELEAQVHELDERLESFIGIAEDERSTPAKRAADLRDAMIRAVQTSSSMTGGVKWWKDEVAEHLAALGHEGLHKPDLYDAMEDAADAAGFELTTKHVRTNGRQMEVKAIRLDPAELPGSADGREVTTPEDAGSATEAVPHATDDD